MSSLGSFLKEAIAGIQVSTIKLQDACRSALIWDLIFLDWQNK
jgi:hypothetical protein